MLIAHDSSTSQSQYFLGSFTTAKVIKNEYIAIAKLPLRAVQCLLGEYLNASDVKKRNKLVCSVNCGNQCAMISVVSVNASIVSQ